MKEMKIYLFNGYSKKTISIQHWKEHCRLLVNMIAKCCFHSLFMHTSFKNPNDANARTFYIQSIKTTNLYDFIETSEKMASSMVKEQWKHFKINKVMEEEVKNPLARWKVHHVQFSCGLTNFGDC